MARTALTAKEINDALESLTGWEAKNDMLVKTFTLPSYLAGLAFATAVGTICEGMDHHPDMSIGYKKVTISFTTHDADSKITAADVKAAKAVEALGYPKASA